MGRLSTDPSTPPGHPLWRSGRPGQSHQDRTNSEPPSRQVSITLSEDCLCRLLNGHQLHVEDFTCCDLASGDCVRRLLLRVIALQDKRTPPANPRGSG